MMSRNGQYEVTQTTKTRKNQRQNGNYKSIIGIGTGNGIFLGKPLEENPENCSRVGVEENLTEPMEQCRTVLPIKGKTLHFWVFSEGIFDTLFFFKS